MKYLAAGLLNFDSDMESEIVKLPFELDEPVSKEVRIAVAKHLCQANGLEYVYSDEVV